MKLAANITTLFTELPVLDRVRAAAEAGFAGVEMQFPYDVQAQDLRDRLVWAKLPMVLFNAPPPNYTGGERGWAAVPGLEDRFRRDVGRALRLAGVLKPERLHLMAGSDGDEATFVANLRWACESHPKQPFTIEVINPRDMPGYFLSDYDLALRVLDAVDAPNLGLQFDTWHAHVLTGDIEATWDRVAPRVTHVQIGAPGDRGEPDEAILAFLKRIEAEGYAGWVGAEYTPRGRTEAGLGWLASC